MTHVLDFHMRDADRFPRYPHSCVLAESARAELARNLKTESSSTEVWSIKLNLG